MDAEYVSPLGSPENTVLDTEQRQKTTQRDLEEMKGTAFPQEANRTQYFLKRLILEAEKLAREWVTDRQIEAQRGQRMFRGTRAAVNLVPPVESLAKC